MVHLQDIWLEQDDAQLLHDNEECAAVVQNSATHPVKSCLYALQDIWLEHDDAQLLHDNEEVTLMDWGNAFIRKIHKDVSGTITGMDCVPLMYIRLATVMYRRE